MFIYTGFRIHVCLSCLITHFSTDCPPRQVGSVCFIKSQKSRNGSITVFSIVFPTLPVLSTAHSLFIG